MTVYDIRVDYKGLDVIAQVSLTHNYDDFTEWTECEWLNIIIMDDCGDVEDYVESTLWDNEEFEQVVNDAIRSEYNATV